MFFSSIIRPIMFKIDEEIAHNLAIKALSKALVCSEAQLTVAKHVIQNKRFKIEKFGLDFANPLGLAAGFDKNAIALPGLQTLGFGALEVGTVTPKPQQGNIKPRIFRLVEQQSIINRLGFNNDGAKKIAQNLLQFRQENSNINKTLIGVNIGANKDSKDRSDDYVEGLRKFYHLSDYFTINISSPNTPNLRDLQHKDNLVDLLTKLSKTRAELVKQHGKHIPIFLKIAPDLSHKQLEDIADIFNISKLEGLIISNTTISRPNLPNNLTIKQSGGLSGKALFDLSTTMLARMRRLIGKDKFLIASGGVDSASSFMTKIKAGADFVQIYTGLIYQGPSLPYQILSQSLKQMEQEGIKHISEYRDLDIDNWAEKNI